MGEVFAQDAEVAFQESGNFKVGRDAIVQEMRRRREKYRPEGSTPWHVITNILIENETEHGADVKSFWTFFVKPRDGEPELKSVGYYDDKFILEGNAWRVHRRVLKGFRRD
jgi:hypothetical protein